MSITFLVLHLSPSDRGGGVWTLLGAIPHRARPVEFSQSVDRLDAQCLPVRPHPVGNSLLPQLRSQPNHLQPFVHALPGVLPGARLLPRGGQQLRQRLAAFPQGFTGFLPQDSGPDEGLRLHRPVAVSKGDFEHGPCSPHVHVQRGDLQHLSVLTFALNTQTAAPNL